MTISRKKVTVKGFMFKGYIRKKINFTYRKIICISITLEWGDIEEETCNQSLGCGTQCFRILHYNDIIPFWQIWWQAETEVANLR